MKRAGKPATFFTLAFLSAVVATLGGCVAPNNAYLMELNRNGKWREAERIGQDMLVHRGTFTHSQVCETYFNVIYAKTRTGKKDEAVKFMADYDAFSARERIDPELLWLGREMTRLKNELGLLGEVQHALVSAMEENRKGNYARARELCDAALAMSDINEVQKATAHFVAAVCSIKLKDVKGAESHFSGFDAHKPALPPDHQALSEEAAARQGLRELRQSLQE
jgi:hypothetical protein